MGHKPMKVNRPEYVHPDERDLRNAKDDTTSSVFGGHRAGKRKRGTSVTKRKQREQTRAIAMDVLTEDGAIVALGVTMVTTTPNREDLTDAQWNGLDVVPLTRSMPDAVSSGKRLGTRGNMKVRAQVVHTTKHVDAGAVVRFVNVCDAILALPLETTQLPNDYVPRKYAKVKPIPTDRFGRE
jgi:hypothetical protein